MEHYDTIFSGLRECETLEEPGATIFDGLHYKANAIFSELQLEELRGLLVSSTRDRVRDMWLSRDQKHVWSAVLRKDARQMWFRADLGPDGWRVSCYVFLMH